MLRTTRHSAFLAGAAAIVALSGCSASVHIGSTLNDPSGLIKKNFMPPPKSVSCPSDISADVGTKFTCTVVEADGSTTKIYGVVDGKNGHVHLQQTPIGSGSATTGTGTTTTGTGTSTTGTGTTTTGTGTSTTGTDTSTTGTGTTTTGTDTSTTGTGTTTT